MISSSSSAIQFVSPLVVRVGPQTCAEACLSTTCLSCLGAGPLRHIWRSMDEECSPNLDACRYIPLDKPSRPTPTCRSILGIQLKVALFCQTLADPKKK